jgi:hypothetical protein
VNGSMSLSSGDLKDIAVYYCRDCSKSNLS